jgi:precorrin-6A synthase
MIEVLVIGIGTGNPDHLTQEAIRALNRVDLFLVADKGAHADDLVALRNEICRTFITEHEYRVVAVADPPRGSDRDRDAGAYRAGVDSWHQRRAQRYTEVIEAELGTSGVVGFLVWGDPAFYDSTLRIVELMQSSGSPIELTVIPGISSVQLLAARHRIALNRVGQPVHLTTGRRLLTEYDPALGDVLVMLDGDLACAGLAADHPDLLIYWGAQLGLPDEALVTGTLADAIDEIRTTRSALRASRGWVMDTYLLRPAEPVVS